MASANLQIIIDALDNASDDLQRLKKEIGGVSEETKKGADNTKKSDNAMKAFMLTAAKVTGTYLAIKKGAEFAYKTISEGADLEYAQTRFENLTASIGTTSNALLTDLRNATKGTRSDFELMASGADFMALGLAKSHDEAVRLTKVAGALGMNMNQLVLTLTNKTTMRFDALGVSVDGFKEKVKALEAAGLDADAAFKEAFLQQAEGQIARVGDRAETSAGQVDKLRASFANLADGIKVALARDALPVVNKVTSELTRAGAGQQLFNKTTAAAKELGIEYKKLYDIVSVKTNWWDSNETITKGFEMGEKRLVSFMGYYAKFIEQGHSSAEALEKTDAVLKKFGNNVVVGKMTQEWANLNDRVWGATEAVDSFSSASTQGILQQVKDITSLSTNFNGIVKLAHQYDGVLQNIADLQGERTALINKGYGEQSAAIKDIDSKIKGLQGQMKNMANQVTLDMFQATIAIGGVTKAEADAYFKLAADMGIISRQGADAAMAAYGNAIDTINGMKIDTKTGEINVDALSAIATLEFLQSYQLLSKEMQVFVKYHLPAAGATQGWADRNYGGSVGGNVHAAATGSGTVAQGNYLWQEHGYQGEIFVPSTNGYILSRADAAAAVSNSSTYNNGSTYHISAMYKQEPVLTLSQEMRIRSTLEALG